MAMQMREKTKDRELSISRMFFEGHMSNGDTGVTPESLRPALISDGALNLPRYHPKYTMNKFRYTEGYDNFGANPDSEDVNHGQRDQPVERRRYDDVADLLDDEPEKAIHVEPLYAVTQKGRRMIVSEVPEPDDIRKGCCGSCCYLCCVRLPQSCCPSSTSAENTRSRRRQEREERRRVTSSSSSGGYYDDCSCWRYLCCKSCSGPQDCCSPWCTNMAGVSIKIIAVVLLCLLALGIGLAVGLGAFDRKTSSGETNVKFNATFKLNDVAYQADYNDVNSDASKALTNRICSTIGDVFNDSSLGEQKISNCYSDKYANGSIWCYMIIEIVSWNVNNSWPTSDAFLLSVKNVFQSDFNDNTGYFRSEFRESTAITDLSIQWITERAKDDSPKSTETMTGQTTTKSSEGPTFSKSTETEGHTGQVTATGLNNYTEMAMSMEHTTSGEIGTKPGATGTNTALPSGETNRTEMASGETKLVSGTTVPGQAVNGTSGEKDKTTIPGQAVNETSGEKDKTTVPGETAASTVRTESDVVTGASVVTMTNFNSNKSSSTTLENSTSVTKSLNQITTSSNVSTKQLSTAIATTTEMSATNGSTMTPPATNVTSQYSATQQVLSTVNGTLEHLSTQPSSLASNTSLQTVSNTTKNT